MALRRLCAASSCGMPSSRLRLWVRARLVEEQGGWGEARGEGAPLLVRARPGGGVAVEAVLPGRRPVGGGTRGEYGCGCGAGCAGARLGWSVWCALRGLGWGGLWGR